MLIIDALFAFVGLLGIASIAMSFWEHRRAKRKTRDIWLLERTER